MLNLRLSPEQAILLLNERIDAIPALMTKGCDLGYYDMLAWCSKTWSTIDEIFGGGDLRCDEIRLVGVPACSCCKPEAMPMQMEVYHSYLLKYIDDIRAGSQTPE